MKKRRDSLMPAWRPTVAVDFDGVLHAYRRGWEDGVIYDDPVEGSHEALRELIRQGFELVVFTARTSLVPVAEWLAEYYPDIKMEVTNIKPQAQFYIDDRAIRFNQARGGWTEAMADVEFYVEDERLAGREWKPLPT